MTKPILIDKEEAAKVLDGEVERAYSPIYKAAYKRLADRLRALPPYSIAPAQTESCTCICHGLIAHCSRCSGEPCRDAHHAPAAAQPASVDNEPLHSLRTYILRVGERVWFYKGAVICELLDDARVIIKKRPAQPAPTTEAREREALARDKAQLIVLAVERKLGKRFDALARHELVDEMTPALSSTPSIAPSTRQSIDHHAEITTLLDSTHCPKHGMEWEECCLAEVALELHNKIAGLLSRSIGPSISEAIAEVKRLRDEWRADLNATEDNECEQHCSWMMYAADEIITALKQLQPSTPSETGWLLEKMHDGQVWYVTVDDLLTWTDDPLKALRLARRTDAELLSTLIDDCEKIAEHEWVPPSEKGE